MMSIYNGITLAMVGPIDINQFLDYLEKSKLPRIIPKGLGGSPVNMLSLELLSRGWQLLIITLSPDVQDEVVLSGEFLKICIGPYTKTRARNFFRTERKYMQDVLLREMPNIVHAHWTYEFAMAAQASNLPHLITAHDAPINILRLNFIPYRIVRTLMAYRVIAKSKRVVSVSPYIAKHLKRYMFYSGHDEVIPNGVPNSLFLKDKETNLSSRDLTFATILNGWAGLKNGQVAIQAFSQVLQKCPNSKLIMFGSGHGESEEAQIYARERNIELGIEFAGKLSHAEIMLRLTNEVDVLVHPSLEESFGMTFIEAMALKIPTIGGLFSGAVPWVLNHGSVGILVDMKKADELAKVMINITSNPEIRLGMSHKGYNFAKKQYHIKVVADAYEKIYVELVYDKY